MESCKKLEFINPVTAKTAPLKIASHVELAQPPEVIAARIGMGEVLAAGQSSIMPMSTTTPYGHSSTFIGSNYRLTGRNLLSFPTVPAPELTPVLKPPRISSCSTSLVALSSPADGIAPHLMVPASHSTAFPTPKKFYSSLRR